MTIYAQSKSGGRTYRGFDCNALYYCRSEAIIDKNLRDRRYTMAHSTTIRYKDTYMISLSLSSLALKTAIDQNFFWRMENNIF